MSRYYFCAYAHTFNKGCQIVFVDRLPDALRKTADLWKKTNGYNRVFVYDMDHNYIWDF